VCTTLRCNKVELLCEVHDHFTVQKRLADKGYWAYDFALPLLVIQVDACIALFSC
jgi:sucrose phosphorylase